MSVCRTRARGAAAGPRPSAMQRPHRAAPMAAAARAVGIPTGIGLSDVVNHLTTEKLRERMGAAAVKAAQAIGYESVGTIEFLVDKNRDFYFMEMNTRIQVEHCVTEEVTNFDLIKEQIKIAAGEPISGKHYLPEMHAIECRINAEDPYNDFRPSPGKITVLHQPGGHGIRIDSHVYAGYVIPPYYDSMIAKIIAVARTRKEAIDTMSRALSEYVIEGVKTTIPFHQQLMRNEDFIKGNFTTKFLETFKMQ